jgi:hypothetical protein
MQCDHGWGIDLDDGSTNYEIYNNVCLSGGLKNREGNHRTVTNNVINGRFTCNVPYPAPTYDRFEQNIFWSGSYSASDPTLWAGIRNRNFFHNPAFDPPVPAVAAQAVTLDDADSWVGDARFADPEAFDFTIAEDSAAHKIGFKNFPMNQFGVQSPSLKKLAPLPPQRIPTKLFDNKIKRKKVPVVLGAEVDALDTESELTATGMYALKGVIITKLPAKSEMAGLGFEIDDVLIEVDGKEVKSVKDMNSKLKTVLKKGSGRFKVMRGQMIVEFTSEVP